MTDGRGKKTWKKSPVNVALCRDKIEPSIVSENYTEVLLSVSVRLPLTMGFACGFRFAGWSDFCTFGFGWVIGLAAC